jgi:hypothetical protein
MLMYFALESDLLVTEIVKNMHFSVCIFQILKTLTANYFVYSTFGQRSQIIYLYWFNKFANLRFNYEDFQSAKTKLWTSSPWEWFILKFIPVTFVRHPGVVEGSRVLMVKKSRTSPFYYQKQYARLGIKY